ncbi:hypothetical protein Tco_1452121 [Tanacetum coccineum]
MPYPRFTKVIINHFFSNRNSLPKRQASFINKIKYDSVLGKLKFIHKGEEHQKYGMSIPDSMMSDAIRNSTHYMTYLALSTNTKVNVPKVGKGKGKGLIGKKKPDADVHKEMKKDAMKKKDEAVKLAESISLTKAEHQDEERRLYETHASFVIGREAKEVVDIVNSDETEDEEEDGLI